MNKLLFLIALPLAAQQPCENLVKLALPDVVIESATPVGAGDFQLPSGPVAKVPAFCRVVGLVKPELKFELWLPAQWNRQVYCGGQRRHGGVDSFRCDGGSAESRLRYWQHGHGAYQF